MQLIERDLQHVWHPCMAMKDFETTPPIPISSAKDCYLYLESGQRLIDATSSWWCKNLGHGHDRLKQALLTQTEKMEHVILANTTNETIVELSERLGQIKPELKHVCYASDGSSAVEIALKISLHAQRLRGKPHRHRFAALTNSYHGETGLALSVSDVGIYREPYDAVLCDPFLISPVPYIHSTAEPTWENCEAYWRKIESQLLSEADNLAAIIVEPLLQGAGNMQIYSKDLLKRLRQFSLAHDIYLIADEIITGLGRTGYPLACDHAEITPDMFCLGKGLTAGFLPMSSVSIHESIFQLFYADYDYKKTFYHSHTHSGNALCASVALETLKILEEENHYQKIQQQSSYLFESMQQVAEKTNRLTNLRHLGWMVAADLNTNTPRAGYAVYQQGLKLGALLRPLGNTIYWMPPFTISHETLHELRDITTEAILACSDLI